MPSIVATQTTYPQNVVSVISLDSTPYYMIQNSMGSFVYGVEQMYLKANSNSQILESYKFRKYNVNGNIESFYEVPTINPYQYQSSLFLDMKKDNVVLDGRTSLGLTILPNETLFLILYTNQLANRDFLPETNFFNNDFFNGYQEIL